MLDLASFQLAFATALTGTRTRGSLEGQPGFAVYRNTTPVALAETLRASYPVVAELLGDALFAETAFAYARHHPASDPVLLGYGPAFPAFLAEQEWIADLPYLPDVAAIERLRTEAHMAADAPALAFADFVQLGSPRSPSGAHITRRPTSRRSRPNGVPRASWSPAPRASCTCTSWMPPRTA